ncbi:MAG: hypothetical protein HY735_10185 [Verrucomicrobia bacterium]|nr:hypothetical protein [Verrucomicrobiota bacterium]
MPIRINLLAEQQAAEEARRRDPVKRAIWAGSAVVALVLLWILNLQFKVNSAQSELARQEGEWKRIEPTYLQVSNRYRETGLIRKHLASLESYSTNRFLWSHALNALQHVSDEKVRVVTFTGASVSTQQNQIVFSTNLYFSFPPRKWWKLWSREPLKTNVLEVAGALLSSITNRADFARFQQQLVISPPNISTTKIQVAVQMEVVKPETITEKIALTIRGRDYSKPHGSRVDPFYAATTNAPFFSQFLGKTNSSVQPDTIQPGEDMSDKINPTDSYIPFTVRCAFPERVRSNE